MTPFISRALGLALITSVTLSATPSWAVFTGDMAQRAPSGDVDYATGKAGFERKDWPVVVNNMLRVVSRRPWHDNAHTYLAYAYRKMQNYDKALVHYGKALDHHPRNRRALSYLGEAYLELCEKEKAEEVMERLLKACVNVAVSFSDGGFSSGCEEYNELKASYDFYVEHGWVEGGHKDW